MTWRNALAIEQLRAEINAAAPARSKVSDGTIGDAAHASRSSDHNPWVIDDEGVGVVRAIDVTHDPAHGVDGNVLAQRIADMLGKHPALGMGAYVIWNRRIVSAGRLGEGWRSYTGSNAHTKHVHVSVATARAGYDSTATWGVMVDREAERLAQLDRQLRRRITRAIRAAKAAGRAGIVNRLRKVRSDVPKGKP